jgi:hypothetical protein
MPPPHHPQTQARARARSLLVHLLPLWQDIDTFVDLKAFLARPHPRPFPAGAATA